MANDRCDQENLHAQLKGGVRALHAPVDNLVSNGAWMVMTRLAWNLKAWLALSLAERRVQRGARERQDKHRVLRMEFKTFVNAFIRLPCQIVHTAGVDLSAVELESMVGRVLPVGRPAAHLSYVSQKPESGCSGPPRRLTTESPPPHADPTTRFQFQPPPRPGLTLRQPERQKLLTKLFRVRLFKA